MRRRVYFVILVLLLGLISAGYIYKYIESNRIKENSTLVEAIVIQRDDPYTNKVNDEDSYEMSVLQHLIVEYELDGKKIEKDMGLVEIYEYSSRYIDSDEISEVEERVEYNIGDAIEIYVAKEGEVYLASVIDSNADSSNLLILGSVMGVVFILILPMALPARRKKKKVT